MSRAEVFLRHIPDSINQILDYTADGKERFYSDRMVQDAVMRNLEIIGEAVKNLPMEARSLRSDIPWKRIAGMRDKLIHEYFGVDLNMVWAVVETELPRFRDQIEEVLEEL